MPPNPTLTPLENIKLFGSDPDTLTELIDNEEAATNGATVDAVEDEDEEEENLTTPDEDTEDDEEDTGHDTGEHLFSPPLYQQRYSRVLDHLRMSGLLEAEKIKSVVDLGCNDCSFIKLLKYMHPITRVYGVDIDRQVLEAASRLLAPLAADYLVKRQHPYDVELLCGSVEHLEPRLQDVDVVVAVELIEHLQPPELDMFPKNVFGHIQPQIAVISTPNSEYNTLFPNYNGQMRHWDHKFEWTRAEFKTWALSVVEAYPEYSVTFDGVGHPPSGPTSHGPCSQIAVFIKTDDMVAEVSAAATAARAVSAAAEAAATAAGDVAGDEGPERVYELVVHHRYPHKKDVRTAEEKLLEESRYYLRILAVDLRQSTEEFADKLEIPVDVQSLLTFHTISQLTEDVEHVKDVLEKNGERVVNGQVVVVLDAEEEAMGICPHTGDMDENGQSVDCDCEYENWGRGDELPENGGQLHENGGQLHENGGQLHESRGQLHENGGQLHENGGQLHENGGQLPEKGGQQVEKENGGDQHLQSSQNGAEAAPENWDSE